MKFLLEIRSVINKQIYIYMCVCVCEFPQISPVITINMVGQHRYKFVLLEILYCTYIITFYLRNLVPCFSISLISVILSFIKFNQQINQINSQNR